MKSYNQKTIILLNANNNDTDIQGFAQDSNKRSMDEFDMVQDSELPENNNLNTGTKTYFDDKENKMIQSQQMIRT